MALPSPSLDTITLTGGIHGPGAFSIDSSGNATVNNLTVDGSFGLSNLTLASLAMTGPITLSGGTVTPTSTAAVASINNGASGAVWSGNITSGSGVFGLAQNIFLGTDITSTYNVGAITVSLVSLGGSTGGLAGITSSIEVNGNGDTGAGLVEFAGFRSFANANYSAPNSNQSLLGATLVGRINAGVSGWNSLTAVELSTSAAGSDAPVFYANAYVMRYADDAFQGSGVDAMLLMMNQYAQADGKGAKVGLSFGPQGLSNRNYPVASDGDVIQVSKGASDGTLAAKNFINAAALTSISDHWVKFGTVFSIDPNGNLDNVGNLTQNAASGANWVWTQTGAGFMEVLFAAGSDGLIVRNNVPATILALDTSGNLNAAGIVQGEFLRLGAGATSTLVSNAGSGNINIGLPNVATTLAGLGLAQTFTATQTFSEIVLGGSTSGAISILATAIAGSNTVTVPAATGTMAVYGAEAAATTPVTFSAAARIPIVIGGTTYYIPLATVTW